MGGKDKQKESQEEEEREGKRQVSLKGSSQQVQPTVWKNTNSTTMELNERKRMRQNDGNDNKTFVLEVSQTF